MGDLTVAAQLVCVPPISLKGQTRWATVLTCRMLTQTNTNRKKEVIVSHDIFTRTQTHHFLLSVKSGVSCKHCLLSITKAKARSQRTFLFDYAHKERERKCPQASSGCLGTAKASRCVALGACHK